MRHTRGLFATSLIAGTIASAGSAIAQDAKRLLFVRGADRSGGFLEAGNDASRTEQLADVTNQATNGGNHGWFELAQALEGAGFVVEQITEPVEAGAGPTGPTDGAPLDFASLELDTYDAVVMGSNNAAYPPEQVDVLESYIRRGGAVLFIADANFGGSWADSSTSDQFFLDRFGWTMQQDRGTYVLRRSDGDFLIDDHPILVGVDAMDGEGVSPIVVPEVDTIAGVSSSLIVRAKPGQQTRNNDRFPGQGTSRPVGPRDAALAVAAVDRGRIAGHIDRNTFFNLNGAGTNINRFDNETYAINLFTWLTDGPGFACRLDFNLDDALTQADTLEAIPLVIAGDPAMDLVAPFGTPDFFDLVELLRAIDAGVCL